MWLASRTAIFFYICFFLAKKFGKQRNEKKNKKNQGGNFEQDERFDNDRGNNQ